MSTEQSAPVGADADLATRKEGLVKRLRMAARHPYMNNTCPANIFDVADAADEIERLELAVSDMQMSYNNCASNADALRDQRDEVRRENAALKRGLIKSVEHNMTLTAALLPFAEADDHMHERCHGLVDRPSLDDRVKWCREYVGLKHFHDARAALPHP